MLQAASTAVRKWGRRPLEKLSLKLILFVPLRRVELITSNRAWPSARKWAFTLSRQSGKIMAPALATPYYLRSRARLSHIILTHTLGYNASPSIAKLKKVII